jgi:AraC family transcriptional regulator, positive regulator of tynA and feaB
MAAAAERWRVRAAGGRRAEAEWEGVLAATHVAFDVRLPAPDADAFAGSVRRQQVGALSLVDCVCMPFGGRRGRAVMGDRGEDTIGLQMVHRGVERVIRPNNRQHVLTAGAVGVWDGSRAVGVDVVEPFRKRTMIFPRELAHAVSPRLDEVEGLSSLARLPATRLLVRYIDALALELPELDARTRAAAADVVLELFRMAVEPELPEPRAARREALRARARRYVRANLADPALGPESIARALSISSRTLHAAFEGSGETIAALIRRTRLARCREDLLDPAAGSVTEIAFRWGFVSGTHFSQLFRHAYGIPPSQVRRSALA